MIKITLIQDRWSYTIQELLAFPEVEVPALPRVGDVIVHKESGIAGRVKEVRFQWPHDHPVEIDVVVA
jgi:hypothetical protein